MAKPIVGITLGDPCGIGPEVVVNTLRRSQSYRSCRPLVIGNRTVVESTINLLNLPLNTRQIHSPTLTQGTHGVIDILDPQNLDPQDITLGEISKLAGKAAVEWVLKAGELAQNGEIQAIATAPINKEAASLAGYKEVGHMELLQQLSKAPQVATMLMSGKLRVVHLTTHKSLRQACDFVTQDNVLQKIRLTHTSFQTWGITKPRIGVAALNPHASDGGLLGSEEEQHIAPAVWTAREQGIDAIGPIGADTIFHQAISGRFDVVLAMYHDQGHIPVKVHGFERSVSVNLGFPFIRTSVDHGTAFDIAGKGLADSRSMSEALRVATRLANGQGLPI
jgi:4-hydroxythreonine-4-phosphate dehydrogenase